MNDSDAPTRETPKSENSLLERLNDSYMDGFDAGVSQALVLVRQRVVRCQAGGELRYPDLRALEAEIASLLDE